MKKRIGFVSFAFLFLIVLVLVLSAQLIFHLLNHSHGSNSVEFVEINMKVLKGQWTFFPNEIKVKQGQFVKLKILNEDEYAHGFAISEYGIDYTLHPLKTTTIEFVADKAGEFQFYCSIMCGHGHFSQTGKLIVEGSHDMISEKIADLENKDLPIRGLNDSIKLLPYEIKQGVKEFHLSVDHIIWDYGNGKLVESYGYNGQLPGPEIRVVENDFVRIVVKNNLPVPTTVHWHGVDVPFLMDGVPEVSQKAINPGEIFVYEFKAKPAGTRIYHTHGSHHGDEGEQLDMGLAGAFIIEPKNYSPPDVEEIFVLTERTRNNLFPINGAIFPNVKPIIVKKGDKVKFRLINAGSSMPHPMHLHGHQFKITSTDGNEVPELAQLTKNVINVNPGESYDLEFIADNPGQWLFHCHELNHAKGGMIALMIYEDYLNFKL